LAKSLADILRRENVNLVHAHSSKAGLIGRVAAALAGQLPFVFTIHGWGFGSGRPVLQAALVLGAEWVSSWLVRKYIAVSEFDRKLGLAILPMKSAKIITICNGVPDNKLLADPAAAQVIIMVARADPQKDHDTFAKSLRGLGRNFQAWLVGGGTDDPNFVSRIRSLSGLPENQIRFFGASSNVSDLLSKASVFCLASRYEGLPLSIIEAMAAGLPIVASNVGGVPELVADGSNGWVVPKEDHAALGKRLAELLASPEDRARMGAASRARFTSEFEHGIMLDRIVGVYESVFCCKADTSRSRILES
jgi:glycosyltransferase involved in cell wall biosynthesis